MAVKGEFRGLLQYTVSTTFKSSFDEGHNAVKLSKRQGFRKFCKVAYISESKGRDIFWRRKVPCERRRLELPRGVWGHAHPPEFFLKEHSETLFPVFLEPKNQFPRQGWSLFKFSLKM